MKDVGQMSPEEIKAFVESLTRKWEGTNAICESSVKPTKAKVFRKSTRLDFEDERHVVWAIYRDIIQFIGCYEYTSDRKCPVLATDYDGYLLSDCDIESQIRDNFNQAYPDAVAACIEMCRYEAGVRQAKPTPRGAYFLHLALLWKATPIVYDESTQFYIESKTSPSSKPVEYYNQNFWLFAKVQAMVVMVLVNWVEKDLSRWVREEIEEIVGREKSLGHWYR